MKDAYAACHRGTKQEAYIIGEYYTMGSEGFAANWMRDNVHPRDIIFNATAFSPNVGIQGYTDGIYFDGTTMFIIEMKSGKRYARRHYAQVVRYAMAMMHTVAYKNVEMHIVYSDIEEVDSFKFNREDIPAEYARVKDHEPRHGDASERKAARIEANKIIAEEFIRVTRPDGTDRTRKDIFNAKEVIRRANRTPAEVKIEADKVTIKCNRHYAKKAAAAAAAANS